MSLNNEETEPEAITVMFIVDLILILLWLVIAVILGFSGGGTPILTAIIFLPFWLYPAFILTGIFLAKTNRSLSFKILIYSPIIATGNLLIVIGILDIIK